MAEPFSQIDSEKLDDSTKLDKGENVKDSIFLPPHQTRSSWTKSSNVIKRLKQESKTDYSLDYSKEFLDLSNKDLSLSDISSILRSRRYLKKLDLSGCGLAELPECFIVCKELEELNLSNNPLKHFYHIHRMPSWDYEFWHGLKKLDLSGCGLTVLPKCLQCCHKLEELNLSNNPLKHFYCIHRIPFWDYEFWRGLKKLDLSGCGLTELPEHFIFCKELEELNLSNNPLSFPYLPCIYISPSKPKTWPGLKKLDMSGCGLTEFPNGLQKYSNIHELNLSDNCFDHQELLEKLNSGKLFRFSCFHNSGNEISEATTASGLGFSKLTRIIFEDAVYTQSSGVWTVAHKDVAYSHYASSTKERYKEQMRLEELNWFSGLSVPNKEIWLDEFCRIRKSEKLTIETYHAMRQSLNIVSNLVSNTVDNCLERESTLSRCCDEILRRFTKRNPASQYVQKCISYLKSAVSWLKNVSIQADDDHYKLQQSITTSEMAFKEASEAFSESSIIADKILAAKLMIISVIFSNLTKPEAAVLRCLQSLQELHDLDSIREEFSSLDREETKTTYLKKEESVEIVKSVFKINKILFEFVRMFFKPPPTVEEWPATIKLMDEQIYNPLIDGRLSEERLIDTGMAVNLHDIVEDDNKVKDPITDVTEFGVIESSGQTPDNSITVNKEGGCFHVPVASAFLLFPPNAVEEKVTLKCSRVKYKECEVKPRDGEFFVSRILKVEPEGLTFKKPVTVLLSHSANEDQDFLYFYELIVENLIPTGCPELKTERISFIEDVPKQISNEEILHDYLPFAKTTIHETCTLVAATRVRSDQILIPTNRSYAYSKQYGDNAELKITFPADVTKKILILKVQLFPADAVVKKDIRLDKNIICAPVIRVSGQETPFLNAVDVELTYSNNDVANIEEEFFSVGKTIQFTTDYGLLLRSQEENESVTKWLNLNESNEVYIERPRKDQLKFSFSVEHFSDIHPVVDMSERSSVPPRDGGRVVRDGGVVDMKNQACYDAYVWAVHKTGINPKTLLSLLAPKQARRDLYDQLKVNGVRFMHRLNCGEPVFFCVPMPDSDHLPLKDNTLWFSPDDISEVQSNTNDSINLIGRYMHFLKDRECNNGRNHNVSSQGDCRAKTPIHILEAGPVQENIEPGIAPKQASGASSSQGDASDGQMTSEDEAKQEKKRLTCEYFEKQIKKKFLNKLEINENNKPVQGKGHTPLTLDDGQLATDIPHNNRSPKLILSRQENTDDSRFEQILKRTKNCDTISDIPYHVREEVKDSLNTMKESRNDWRGVASRMGVKSLTIEKIKKDFKEDPTDKLFHELSSQKITKLLHVLYEMECQDVLNIFYDNFCINISDTAAGVESYQGSKFPSHESTPGSGISSASCEFVICPEPISPFNVREDPGTPESLESTTSASEFGRIFSQPPHSRPNAGLEVKQNTDEDFGSSRESSCVDKKSNESPLVDKNNQEILEETGSPSTETKFRSGLFNIVKSNNITINEEGGCFHVPVASAFFLFPPNAVEEEVTLMCSRLKLKYKECEVKPRDGEVFVSRILKIEPEGVKFKKPVTVLLSHSLYEDQDFLYFYELIVESLSPTGWQELKTERISSIKDVPKEIPNKKILDDYLPFAKATIHETYTLVAATRVRSDQILIPTNERYTFSKQYGDKTELNITFPAGVTEKTLILAVQLFPARAVLNRDIRSDKNLVCVPIIKVSGQKTPFFKAVDIELIYSHSDVSSIEEEFLPVGKRVKFTTEYGLLLRSHRETESKSNWQALNESNDVYIERSRKDQLKFAFSVEHFCYILSFVKRIIGSILPLWSSGMVETNNPACHSAIALAVHKTDSSPKTLRAVLAPAVALSDVKTSWNAETDKIRKFDEPLKSKEPIYFCVPLSDSHHLPLKDHTLRFDPDPVFPLVLDNNTDDNLNGKYMHFLTDRDCNNGENHSTQGDCHAKAPIHISETRSVQARECHELVLGSESPQDSTPSFEQKIISINDLSVDACRVGRVTSVTPYGAYVDIGVRGREGLLCEGLLHKSEFPSSKDLETGDTYSVVCTDVNKTGNLIGLRLK